jgi:tetratricopeptide (TPR) repeat protein
MESHGPSGVVAINTVAERFRQGVECHRSGRLKQAAQVYHQVVDTKSDYADAWHVLGLVVHQAGLREQASRGIGRAVELQPDNAAFRNSLDSGFGGSQQRGAAHEFRHLPGLRDEYPAAPDCARTWRGDTHSIMHSGEQVRARHYAMFAAWITEQFADAAHLASEPVTFKVGGTVDVQNAHL